MNQCFQHDFKLQFFRESCLKSAIPLTLVSKVEKANSNILRKINDVWVSFAIIIEHKILQEEKVPLHQIEVILFFFLKKACNSMFLFVFLNPESGFQLKSST